jgi:ribosomal-protein-alanine N-acetyltransferase
VPAPDVPRVRDVPHPSPPPRSSDDPVAVEVRPASPDELRALIEGADTFTARFGRPVEPGYLSFDGVLEHSLEAITTGGVPAEWYTHLFFAPGARGALLGIGGFKGPPDGGAVEIGYEIAPGRRGAGRASAAARALISIARDAGCTLVVARTLAEESPSTSVLTRLGFERTATVVDPEEGAVWRWELTLGS